MARARKYNTTVSTRPEITVPVSVSKGFFIVVLQDFGWDHASDAILARKKIPTDEGVMTPSVRIPG